MAGPNRDQDLFVGGEVLSQEKGVDGQGTYKIINPERLYLGKTYSDWTTDWFNWFLSANADRRNAGPVVFLRSRGLPDAPDRSIYFGCSESWSRGNRYL